MLATAMARAIYIWYLRIYIHLGVKCKRELQSTREGLEGGYVAVGRCPDINATATIQSFVRGPGTTAAPLTKFDDCSCFHLHPCAFRLQFGYSYAHASSLLLLRLEILLPASCLKCKGVKPRLFLHVRLHIVVLSPVASPRQPLFHCWRYTGPSTAWEEAVREGAAARSAHQGIIRNMSCPF